MLNCRTKNSLRFSSKSASTLIGCDEPHMTHVHILVMSSWNEILINFNWSFGIVRKIAFINNINNINNKLRNLNQRTYPHLTSFIYIFTLI